MILVFRSGFVKKRAFAYNVTDMTPPNERLKIFTRLIKKNIIFFLPLIPLIIFLISIWDRNFYIGGDLIFPLAPQNNLLKAIYLWQEENGGLSFFRYMFLIWHVLFLVPSFFKIPADVGIKIVIVFFYVIGFIFTYLTYRILFKKTRYNEKIIALTAAMIFILNPTAILVVIGFHPLYSFPVCAYFLLKYLERKNFLFLLPFALFFNFGFLSDLPQAKSLITFSIGLFFLILLYKFLNKLSFWKILKTLFPATMIVILLNAFVLLPFINDAFGRREVFKQYAQSVTTYNGMTDVPSAALPFTMRFYNSNLVDGVSRLGQTLSNPSFLLWSFFIWVILLWFCFLEKDKHKKKITYLLLAVTCFYFFLAKGANPPFGEIYKYFLFNVPFFKVFRTSSTAVVAGSLFFAFLMGLSLYGLYKKHKKFFYLFILIHVLVFHFVYLGYKLYNYPGGSAFQKGVSLPKEYFQMAKRIDSLPYEDKILSLPLDDGYSYKDWDYKGSSIINWLTKKPLIHSNSVIPGKTALEANEFLKKMTREEACQWLKFRNVGYLLHEKDSIDNYADSSLSFPSDKIFEDKYFLLKKVKAECVLPTVFVTKTNSNLNITFKKINPTKYMINIQDATQPYTLFLAQNYSPEWKIQVQRTKTKNKDLLGSSHFLASGETNGWQINPEDVGNETNYVLVIEYWPQRLFSIGGIISILTIIFCLITVFFKHD